jgi:hypothetical protein
MNHNRLGCLSPSAILAVLLTLIVSAGFAIFNGSSLFSPGSLNARLGQALGGVRSHAEIGSDCARCHPAPWEADTQAQRCMGCHADITKQLSDPASMHGVMLKNSPLACRACHSDHRGPEAALTNMTTGSFPHAATGYALTSHKRRVDGLAFTCTDCHGQDVTRFDPAVCGDCHLKLDSAFLTTHDQSYGTGCRGCHDGVETISKNFDHSRAAFKIEGRHRGLVCEKCHLNAHTAADFKARLAGCGDCHSQDDAHEGQFGLECGTCHSPAGWEPASFDHNRSAFPLEGKHAEAKCADCHINKVFKGTSTACYACHQKDDEHAGKFGQDCGACHKPAGWKPATFDHNLSAFKLTGAHVSVACEKCHVNNVFKGTSQVCSGCHADPAFHLGLFKAQECSTCHNTGAWSPAIFNLAHPEPATGEGGSGINHGGAACRDCHTTNLMAATCTKCHDNNSPGGEGSGGKHD